MRIFEGALNFSMAGKHLFEASELQRGVNNLF
jgi:hypothetical protein